jgi:hypothetical protein
MFLHAWDLAEDGVDATMEWMKTTSLNTLCMASTYHSGWLVQPNSRYHRSLMTEGSACYFHPREEFYKKTRIRPKTAEISRSMDWFAEAAKIIDRYDLRLVAWTIGCHNTNTGLAHPDLTLRNVYGDHLWHGLCPSNRQVREYLKSLCRNLATAYPLWALQLESFDWMSYSHGHHHERDLVGLQPVEKELMSYCFCTSCQHGANHCGIEVNRAAALVREVLDDAFREAPHRPPKHPRTIAELESRCPELARFNAWRKTVVRSLLGEIKLESLKGTSCRLLLQSGFDPHLAGIADGFACVAYNNSPEETEAICREGHRCLPVSWKGLFQCLVQLGMGVPRSEAQLVETIQALQRGGCNGVNFYNRSESPPKMLRWLQDALPKSTASAVSQSV